MHYEMTDLTKLDAKLQRIQLNYEMFSEVPNTMSSLIREMQFIGEKFKEEMNFY